MELYLLIFKHNHFITCLITCLVGCSCICILNLSTTLQLLNTRAVCLTTISIQYLAFIVPSGSTTLYLFGAVHNTVIITNYVETFT